MTTAISGVKSSWTTLYFQRVGIEFHHDSVVVQGEAEHSPEAVLIGGEVKVGAFLQRLVELREKFAPLVHHNSVAVDLHLLWRFCVELITDDRLRLVVVVEEASVVDDVIVSLQVEPPPVTLEKSKN